MKRSTRKILIPCLALLAWRSAPLAAQAGAAPTATLRELERDEADLYRLEATGLTHATQLLEPLSRIADHHMALGRYVEANAALDRAQQIVRIEEGLYTKSQLPFLQRRIENYVNAGNWRAARKLQNHVIWFYLNRYEPRDEDMMNGLLDLYRLHLRGIAEDLGEHRGYHHVRAAYSSRVALVVADSIWPDDERRKAGLIYEQLRIMHLQASAIGRGGKLAHDLRAMDLSPGADGFVRERVLQPEAALDALRVDGLRHLERLRELYADGAAGESEAEQAGDEEQVSEALAMVRLYLADWRLLFDQKSEALETYRQAWDMLLQAGVAKESVAELFASPSLIPHPQFHDNVADALRARSRESSDIAAAATATFVEGVPVRIFFDLDEELLAEAPLSPEQLDMPELADWQSVALFSFELPGMSDIETRPGWRRVNAFGVAQNLALVEWGEVSGQLEVEPLMRSLVRLRFRPGLTDGVPHAAAGLIGYLIGMVP